MDAHQISQKRFQQIVSEVMQTDIGQRWQSQQFLKQPYVVFCCKK